MDDLQVAPDQRTLAQKLGIIPLAIGVAIAVFIGMIIAGLLIGLMLSGFIHGEAGEWFGLLTAGYGALAGLVFGPIVAWKMVARRFGVSLKNTRVVALGLLVIIPAAEYVVLKMPSVTGPSMSSERLIIQTVSNDGKLVLVESSGSDSSRLYKISTDSGAAVRLTGSTGEFEQGAQLSPDEKKIVFLSHGPDSHLSEIMLCDVDGGNLHKLFPESHGEISAQFSHDGKRIYFGRSTSMERYKTAFDLYSVSIDGSDSQQLTHRNFDQDENTYGLFPETVSSDGAQVLMNARSFSGDKFRTYSLKDDNQPPVVIAPQIPNGTKNAIIAGSYFTPDGKSIMFMAASEGAKGYDYDIYLLDVATAKVEKLTNTKSYSSDFTLSNNGQYATYLTWGSSRLNKVPINPSLHILNTQTRLVSNVTITGLSSR